MKRIFLTKCLRDAAVPILNDALMSPPKRTVLLFASFTEGQHTGKRLSLQHRPFYIVFLYCSKPSVRR